MVSLAARCLLHSAACIVVPSWCPRFITAFAKARSKAKKRPTRGLDLEEVRRRTSLLSGEARTSPPPARAPTPPPAVAPRPADASSHYDSGWRRQQTLVSPVTPGEVPHPLLHTAAADPLSFGGGSGGSFDNRGNYFNEDLLLARAQGSKPTNSVPVEERSTGRGAGQGAWGGDALLDSAGSFLSTARWVTPDVFVVGVSAEKWWKCF